MFGHDFTFLWLIEIIVQDLVFMSFFLLNRVEQFIRNGNDRMVGVWTLLSDWSANRKRIERRLDDVIRRLAIFFEIHILTIVEFIFKFHSLVGLLIIGGKCIEGILKFIASDLGRWVQRCFFIKRLLGKLFVFSEFQDCRTNEYNSQYVKNNVPYFCQEELLIFNRWVMSWRHTI